MKTLTNPALVNKGSFAPPRKPLIKWLAVIALVATSASAQADSTTNYTFSLSDIPYGGSDKGFGTLTVNSSGLAIAGTLNLFADAGEVTGSFNLVTSDPIGWVSTDNLVNPNGNPPVGWISISGNNTNYLDSLGLIFAGGVKGQPGSINILSNSNFGTNMGNYTLTAINSGLSGYVNDSMTFTLTPSAPPPTPTPVPAAIWMVGSTLAGTFGFMRRKMV